MKKRKKRAKKPKKNSKKNNKKDKKKDAHQTKLTFGQKAADALTKFAGSWAFIIMVLVFIGGWTVVNILMVINRWDPYPFILLNLLLSCLAAIQAPVILMSQNREVERDRSRIERDYYINRKAEREVEQIQKQLKKIRNLLDSKGKKSSKKR